jgi:hypothetical protein
MLDDQPPMFQVNSLDAGSSPQSLMSLAGIAVDGFDVFPAVDGAGDGE